METDFLVIGSGIAGLTLALKLSLLGRVTLLCKKGLMDTNTHAAQGGIASVFSETDSFEKHVQDTLDAGAGLCHLDIVRKVISSAPHAIEELIGYGVNFTRLPNSKHYHLTQEGGHSERRIFHKEDMTGAEIQKQLSERVRENKNITLLEHHMAIDLLTSHKFLSSFKNNTCFGVYALDDHTGKILTILAKHTFLATGGLGKLYLYTSNPDIATGDGVAMAYRAGASVANLEFMQFHPTCLYHPKAKNFLISEALRGEGAHLLSIEGKRFIDHPQKELAPRDIVARAIDAEMKRSGAPHVYLDITHKGAEFITKHFPGIYEKCLTFGINIIKEPIPVVPAAHYSCGGLVTDDEGKTNILNLWALGEVACTGLHGANRLASNSLLEGVVFANAIYKSLKNSDLKSITLPSHVPSWKLGQAGEDDEMVVLSHLWDEIRRTMWNYVGIVRTDKRLARARTRIDQINQEIEEYYWNVVPNRNLIELRNIAILARLTINSARLRKESRGIHYSLDYPHKDDESYKKDTILC
jgi:L-aspartate oxidase